MKTIDEFFGRVQAEGFNGYSPSKNDVLGDAWSRKIGEVFETVANEADLPREKRHTVWLVFQWLYCELAGMRSRIIASPPACRAAGVEINEETVKTACDLLWASQDA